MRIISIILLLFVSCNPLKHYQKVAIDTKVTAEKKATIAPFVAIHFPVQVKYVKGDTIVEVIIHTDTITNIVNDTSYKTIINTKVITKKIVDTIYMTNEAERYALQQTILNYENEIRNLQDVNNQQEKKIMDIKEERNILRIGLILLALLCIFIVYKIFLA